MNVAVLFALTVFLNAALLFSVEPMIAKMVLPVLGGAPAVWNTAMVFFQSVLLLGYGYAHVSATRLVPRWQVRVHLGLVGLSLLTLPLTLRFAGEPPTTTSPIGWLLLTMLLTLGLPFAVLSSGAPLLQRWFTTSTRGERDPYPLYAASNVGSLFALLAYPFVIEPALSLAMQRVLWSIAYLLVAGLLCACAWQLHRMVVRDSVPASHATAATSQSAKPGPSWRRRGNWLVLAAVPSSLLLGTTTFIATDVASVPLLWVLPLSLYLLSFIIVFARYPAGLHRLIVRLETAILLGAAALIFFDDSLRGLSLIAFFCTLLFVVSLVCHGELARQRPEPVHLTDFFLVMSVGGLLGSMFNALVAPVVFDDVFEYPIAIMLAALLRPSLREDAPSAGRRIWDLNIALAVALLLYAGLFYRQLRDDVDSTVTVFVLAAVGALLLRSTSRPLRFGLTLGAVLAAPIAFRRLDPERRPFRTERSFYGVYRIYQSPRSSSNQLVHGTTIHGIQSRIPKLRLKPISYYDSTGPTFDFAAVDSALTARPRTVGVVGLGLGAIACYGRQGESWTFYEIDPLVETLARDDRYFTYLRECPPKARVVHGDARRTLAGAQAGSLDLLVLDAFSSDAIPVHLLTREALSVYTRALAPDGLIAVHISNMYLNLEPVVSALAQDAGLAARIRRDVRDSTKARVLEWFPSTWIVMSRDTARLRQAAATQQWKPLVRPGPLWTDDYSNLLHVLW